MFEPGLVLARDRKRLAEIGAVAVRYGLDDVLARIGLGAASPFLASRSRKNGIDGLSAPERARFALEALGPTFIKLGQILSTRADLLPSEWTAELEKLQSQVSPTPWEQIRAQVEKDLGAPVEEVFAQFDTEAMAAGSIAQVHRARIEDGREVVVKIRRAGLRAAVEADLRLLSHIAGLAEEQWTDLARYRPRAIVRQLGVALSDELDLSKEGRNCEIVARNLGSLDYVRIPQVHSRWTSERLLVQEFIEGATPGDGTGWEALGLDGRLLAKRGAGAFMHMVLVDGFFHADPHPGNLRLLAGNRVAFIDFGMVGRLGSGRREQLLRLAGAMATGSGEGVARQLADWAGDAGIDLPRLETACDAFVARHGRPPLRLREAVDDFMAIAREHDLVLPGDLALLARAVVASDSATRSLDPDFDPVAIATPVVHEVLRQRYALDTLLARSQGIAQDVAGALSDLPSILRLVTLRLRQGRIAADIEIKGIERLGDDIRWGATRIAVAVVIAAFALGLAPRILEFGPSLLGAPLTGWIGVAVILVGTLWLLAASRR